MSRKEDEIQDLRFTVEALEDEVAFHQEALLGRDLRIEQYEEAIDRLNLLVRDKQARVIELVTENDRLTMTYEPYEPPKAKKAGNVSFDFWPLREWIRLSLNHWQSGGYFQLCVGPVRFEIYEA